MAGRTSFIESFTPRSSDRRAATWLRGGYEAGQQARRAEIDLGEGSDVLVRPVTTEVVRVDDEGEPDRFNRLPTV